MERLGRLLGEDCYGDRGDDAEDTNAVAAANAIATAVVAGTVPPFTVIRFKSFEAARGLRTLDLFISGLASAGENSRGPDPDPAQGN